MQRINDKIDEIETYLNELIQILPENFQQYLDDLRTKAACERYFEKIIETASDIAFLTIKELNLNTPEDDKQAFNILAKENIITNILCDKLRNAKGMRNIIAHDYGIVDDKIVFESITEELIEDVTAFIEALTKEKGKIKN